MSISSNTMLHKGLLDMQNLDADSAADPTAEGAMYFSGSSTSGTGTARFNFNSGVKAPKLKIGSGAEVTEIDNGSLGSSATKLATQGAIKTYVDAQVTAQDLDVTADSGTLDIDLDDESFSIVGATGLGTSASGTTLTVGISAGGVGTTQLADDGVTADKLADDAVVTANIVDANVTTAKIANDAITGAKIALFDDSLAATTTHFLIADGTDYSSFALSGDVTCTNAGLVTIAANAVEGSMLNNNIVSGLTDIAAALTATDEMIVSDAGTIKRTDVSRIGDFVGSSADFNVTSGALSLANNSVGTLEIEDSTVTTAKLAADAIDGTKLADNAVDSEHYTDGSIDLVHMSANSVDSDQYVDGSIDLAHMSANSVDSDQYVDGSVDNVHLANSSTTIGATSCTLGTTTTAFTGLTGLDFTAANASVAASLGANTLTLGGAASTVALANDVTIAGDLTVNGDTVTVNSTVVAIDDKVMVFASGSTNGQIATANGAGFAIGGDQGDAKLASFLYDGSDSFDVSDHLNLASGQEFKINDVSTLSATTLGSAVVNSSLTTVGTIATGVWNGTAIASAYIAADAIDGTKLADNAIDSEHYTDGSIDLAHMSANSVDSDQYVDGSIDTAHFAAGAVDVTAMGANSVDSDQYVDGSIDLVHMSANSVDSDQYVDGSIDTAHFAAGAVDVTAMGANSVDSDQYVDGSIDLAHMSANSVDSDQYVDGSVDNVHLANSSTTIGSTSCALGSTTTTFAGLASVTSTAFVGDLTGDVTGNSDTATVAARVTITDNENTNENNVLIFAAGADADGGNLGLESDGNLIYNPASGLLTSPSGFFSTGLGFGTGVGNTLQITGSSLATGAYAIDVQNANSSKGRMRANAFVTYSERALKSEIKDLTNPMAKLNALRPVTYNWKASDTKASGWKSEEIGFIADEVQQVVPQIVATTADGYAQGIDYSKLTALLTQAVKVQDTEIQGLKAQLSKVLKALELKG